MARIVIYDSGVGGLSIYHELSQSLEQLNGHHSLVFVSDNAAHPYGTKNDVDLIDRISLVALTINKTYAPDILLIACNTASTIALQTLRSQLDCEVVGVVPAIKPAANISQTKTIGLLATPVTIKRSYTDKLINDFAKQCRIVKVGSSELVEMAEAKLAGQTIELPRLRKILQPFIECQSLDVVVLACTHFPLLREQIAHVFMDSDRSIMLVDSGEAISRRVVSLLEPSMSQQTSLDLTASFTDVMSTEASLVRYLHKLGFADIEYLKI